MKKTLSLFLAFIMALSVTVIAFAADSGLIIYSSEGTKLSIVISEDAPSTDKTAAEKLQYYLKKCTGVDFEISTKSREGIFVGTAGAEKTDTSSLKDEGYLIKVIDSGLVITGIGKRGTIYGVYDFLKKFCGCRWYTKDLIITPATDIISIPNNTDITFNHIFEYRETDWISPRDREYSLANHLNSGIYRQFDESNGGVVKYIGADFGHTLARKYCARSKYFETNPEFFALHNGKRTGNQLCLSNEDTYQIVLSEVMGYLKDIDKNDKNLQILSLTQDDNQDYCECDKCKASDEKYGSHAGSLLLFINRIAEEVEKAGYNNVVIDTFAYQYTRKTPTGIEPRDNVVVRLCSIECCFCHPLDDADCELNVEFMKDLRNWSKICNRLYIWDYTVNYYRTLITFSDFGVLQKNMQIFAENGVKGVYEEGAYYAQNCNGEFAELRSYLLSCLLSDPYMDYETEKNAFIDAYYGGSAPYIKEYLDILQKAETENDHMTIYDKAFELYQSLKKKDIKHIDELWKSALNADGTDYQKENTKRSEISWEAWKAENKVDNYSRLQLPSVWMGENEKLFNRLKEENITIMQEGSDYIISDPAYMNYIVASNPYFWFTSKLGNEKVIKEWTGKYDRYTAVESKIGFILEPMLKLLNNVFGK